MDEEIKKRLDAQDELLAKIYKSTEKTRKYFFWTLVISLIFIFLPLVALVFLIPKFLGLYTSALGGF
jgi:ABC-type arginine transport system permease subunit